MQLLITDLNKSFHKTHVLKDINLSITSGNIFGYLGRNGAGKTTSLRILMDVFEADSGSITLNGEPFNPEDYRIGYLPEERGMYSKFKVKDQLIYFARLRGASKRDAETSMHRWSKTFGIDIYLDDLLETLSKGNQQKVQIAQAFISEPDILILDEPFSGLDPVNAKLFQDAILNYRRDDRIIIFSSHQMSYVESLCDDIAIIHHGEIILDGHLETIRHDIGDGKLQLRFADTLPVNFLSDYTYTTQGDDVILSLPESETKQDFLQKTLQAGIELTLFMDYLPRLHDLFIERTGDHHETV